MPCFNPITGYRYEDGTVKFNEARGMLRAVTIPCGQCIGCRIQRTKDWALRCVHEASLHTENCFITLTYNDENLPPDEGLVKRDFQLFMKRLRKRLGGRKIKYYMCGEYGSQLGRPHYHAIVFGWNPHDLEPFRTFQGVTTYESKMLADVWGLGFVTVGDVTWQSAAYVARYCMKKITGDPAELHYTKCDRFTGELIPVHPEYAAMSKGIGKGWYEKYSSDCFPSDFLIHDGKKLRVPKYYERMFQLDDPHAHEDVVMARLENAEKHAHNNTDERLEVRHEVLKRKLDKLKRTLE